MANYRFETIVTKNNTKKTIIKAEGFDYKKNHEWFTSHGFRYFGVGYNEKAEGRRYSYWGIDATKLQENFPECYKAILEKAENAPKKAEVKEELIANLDTLLKLKNASPAALAKMKKADIIAIIQSAVTE